MMIECYLLLPIKFVETYFIFLIMYMQIEMISQPFNNFLPFNGIFNVLLTESISSILFYTLEDPLIKF